ncbi:hypothetical protein [Synechococcus sp. CS-205]|uniref:hypothetical protein n=1 Tax=Synechococcus sp. CS-205 TaxID=2847984 RepID=UPI00223C371A|nr:hypothetical protein [Synechococcus sp. CS-205]MCT0249541.1 hypothetical protein [Synechococcus sp. CS-205]
MNHSPKLALMFLVILATVAVPTGIYFAQIPRSVLEFQQQINNNAIRLNLERQDSYRRQGQQIPINLKDEEKRLKGAQKTIESQL